MPKHDPEMIAIARVRSVLTALQLQPHQRLLVLQYIVNGELSAQNAAEQATVHRAAEALGREDEAREQRPNGGSGAGRLSF